MNSTPSDYTCRVVSENGKNVVVFRPNTIDFGDGVARDYSCKISERHDGSYENWYCERGSLRARAGYGVNRIWIFATYREAETHAQSWAKRAARTP
jgi:hypothetical protein